MKRVRCPKCDNFITFDETKYEAGQSLVFVCPNCNKQFGIRMGVSKLRETRKEEQIDENANENGVVHRRYRKRIRLQAGHPFADGRQRHRKIYEEQWHQLPYRDRRSECRYEPLRNQCKPRQERKIEICAARWS